MKLWRKLANHSGTTRPRIGLASAALRGASLDELCQEACRSLEPILAGIADRFGIWLVRDPELHDGSVLDSFHGRLWTDSRETDLAEFQHSPFPVSLFAGGPPIEQDLPLEYAAAGLEATSGMRRALWVPIRIENDLQGVLLAATRNSSAKFPHSDIDRLAAELALVIAFRAQSASAKAKSADLAETRKLCGEICSGISLDSILQKIIDSSLRSAGNHAPPARFATLGLLPETAAASAPADPHLDFRWYAGDNVLARSAEAEPISTIWRQALQSRVAVGKAPPARWSHSEVSRVVAIPLLVAGESRGVLVVGLGGSSATLATLERLELRASLAAAAIAISASRSTEASARGSFHFLLQHTSDPVFLLNPRMEITDASAAGKALLSASAATLSQQTNPLYDGSGFGSIAQIFKPAEWLCAANCMQKMAKSASPSAAHCSAMQLKSGRSARLRVTPLPAGGFALIFTDVHGKHDSASIRAAAELHSLIEWLDQGILLFDENESLRAINPRFSQLFGLDAEDLQIATSLRALVGVLSPHVSDPPQFAARWWNAANGIDTGLRDEIHVVQPAPRFLERISRPILDSNGINLGRLEIYRDLTTQQLFQAKLQKSEHLASLGEKLSAVAHELSNPLTTILGYAQRLLRNPGQSSGSSAQAEDLQRIFSEADRASSILRQLLASSRASAPDRRPLDLNSLLRRGVELQRFQLASEQIRLELDLSPSIPPVLCDAGQLQQILMNLISNARHAVLAEKPNGLICVRTRTADSGGVILEVSDSGPGIPEALRHRIFDPFFTTKPSGVGTGLGLSIVVGLVRQNHGNIRVRSEAGQGATFSIDFPAAQAIPEVPASLLPPALSFPSPSLASGRVLVIEDEPTVAQLIADMLSDLGYSSDVQHDARRALVFALNREYSLIICDMKMPGLDGQHFYRALVEAGSVLASKFLFVTGDVLGVSTQEFLRSHRLPHIAKPFRLEEFADKLAQVLEPVPPAASPAVMTDLSHKNLLSHG